MSQTSLPIAPDRFAAALESLSIPSIWLKADEIRNSLLHLRLSNSQLQEFADQGDADCAEALKENEGVVARLRERLDILKAEVEARGARWMDWDVEEAVKDNEAVHNTHGAEGHNATSAATTEVVDGVASDHTSAVPGSRGQTAGGTLDDDELARHVLNQLEQDDGEDDGMHL